MLTKEQVLDLAKRYKVSPDIIYQIEGEWADTLKRGKEYNDYYESITEIKNPIQVSKDWAELSIFYHDNKDLLDNDKSEIIGMATFTPIAKNKKKIVLSEYYANKILISFINNCDKSKFYDRIMAEETINYRKRRKTKSDIFNRDQFIQMSGQTIKQETESYAPLIQELLNIFDLGYTSQSAIKKVFLKCVYKGDNK